MPTAEEGAPASAPGRHLPGEPGIWMLIGGDLVLFSTFFVLFLVYRWDEPSVFAASRLRLSQDLGLLNTLLMLSSSWCVATAIRAARRRLDVIASRLFWAALACGAGFCVVKYFEWSAKIAADLLPTTNTFFMFYFVYTGIHLVHVVLGMAVLTALAVYVQNPRHKLQHLETGASFWHLVDLLWIVLFALLYLVG